jgi:hypothetical protein
MKRNSIREMEERLDQLEGLERMKRDMEVGSKNCWWTISTPKMSVNIENDNLRRDLLQWITAEIAHMTDLLKLED